MSILRDENGFLQLVSVSDMNNVSEKSFFREGMTLKSDDFFVGGIEHEQLPEQRLFAENIRRVLDSGSQEGEMIVV